MSDSDGLEVKVEVKPPTEVKDKKKMTQLLKE